MTDIYKIIEALAKNITLLEEKHHDFINSVYSYHLEEKRKGSLASFTRKQRNYIHFLNKIWRKQNNPPLSSLQKMQAKYNALKRRKYHAKQKDISIYRDSLEYQNKDIQIQESPQSPLRPKGDFGFNFADGEIFVSKHTLSLIKVKD